MPCVVYSDSHCGGLGISSGVWRLALRRIRDADEVAGVPAICVVQKMEPEGEADSAAAWVKSAPVVGLAFVVQVEFPPLSDPGQVATQLLHGLGTFPAPGTAATRSDYDLGRIFLIVGSCCGAEVGGGIFPLNPSTALSSDLELGAGPAFAQTVYRATMMPMADRAMWAERPGVRHITYCHGHLLRFLHTFMTATNELVMDSARRTLRGAAAPAASDASRLRSALDRLLRRSGPGDCLLADMVPDLLRLELKRPVGLSIPDGVDSILPWVEPDFELCTLMGVRIMVRGGTAGMPRPTFPDDVLAMLAAEPERRPLTAGWLRIMAELFPGPEVVVPVTTQRCAFVPVGVLGPRVPERCSPRGDLERAGLTGVPFQPVHPAAGLPRTPSKRPRIQQQTAPSPAPVPAPPLRAMDARAPETPEGCDREETPKGHGDLLRVLPLYAPAPLAEFEAQLMRCSAVSADPVLTRLVTEILPGGGARGCIDAERSRLHALQAKRTQVLRSVVLRVVEYYVRAKPVREGRPPPHTLQFLKDTIERDVAELHRLSKTSRLLKDNTGHAMLRIFNAVQETCGVRFAVPE